MLVVVVAAIVAGLAAGDKAVGIEDRILLFLFAVALGTKAAGADSVERKVVEEVF